MDEKDHCSTEDISDSEMQLGINKSRVGQTNNVDFSTDDHENLSGATSLPCATDDSSIRSTESSSTVWDNNSSLPLQNTHPSPRPRKFSSLGKPQPVPRTIPQLKTCGQHFDQSNEDNSSVISNETTKDIRTDIPNIPNQHDSVEENIQVREELNEKQDVGREKKSISDYNENKEISRNAMSNSTKAVPSNSKRFSRNSSGIPMSRLPSRTSPLRSSIKIEPTNIVSNFDTCQTSGGDHVPIDVDDVDKPVTSKEAINSSKEAKEPACSKQESNMRSGEPSEAVEALNKDLNGKYDDLLFEKRKLFSYSDDPDECRVSSSKDKETSISYKGQFNISKNKNANLGVSEEDNNQTSVTSTSSSTYAPPTYSSQVPESSKETSEADTVIFSNNIQGENLTRHSDNYSAIEDNLSTDVKKSDSNKSLGKILDISPEFLYSPRDSCMVFNDKKEERLEMSCNDSANVDTRMLDPDAMIESLDRFTAELVSQASSHLQNKDSLYKSSNNDNTWDENSSPNEATFPSISLSAPNVVSFNSESENNTSSNRNDLIDTGKVDMVSNDFSSLNTTTMTDSTLIAMEATKIVEAFKEETDMSSSVNSLVSLELDQVQPPSHLNSLSNSIIGFLDSKPGSPKMTRKKSLPSNIMVKRALNHSLSHNSSVEYLDHHMSYKEEVNSANKVGTSETLPNDISDPRKSFIINGPVNGNYCNKNFSTKMPSSFLNLETSSQLFSVTDLDNINPPSMFNEVTDLCNSLADVATTSIGTETEIFEDCFTHVTDNHLQTENDVTEFSDANSITPIQSSTTSSSENTPKKKSLNKSLTSKQKRALAKERYKTYIIAAEMVMKDSMINQEDNSNEVVETQTKNNKSNSDNEDSLQCCQTFDIDTKASKLSPKERRLSERARFQTQVLEVSQIPNFHSQNLQQEQNDGECDSSKEPSPNRSKISVRKNILQRRLSNKDRFKTQTLDDSQLSPDLLGCENPISNDTEIHLMVEKGANKVLKTLRDANVVNHDEILDCETISLVSNDDESEPNSGSSVNYRTYHKSWGLRNNIPVITCNELQTNVADVVGDTLETCSIPSDDEVNRVPPKPKIVKPDAKKIQEYKEEVEQPKGIRGRRKALYSKSNLTKVTPKSIKPVKNVTSNVAKNVTSTLKSATPKPVLTKPSKIATRPPTRGKTVNTPSRPVSGNGNTQITTVSTATNVAQRNLKPGIPRPGSDTKKCPPKPLERQGTFTKDDNPSNSNQSKTKSTDSSRIPAPGSLKSSIPKFSSKQSGIPRSGVFKSSSSDRSSKPTNIKIYNRSTSADSRESTFSRKIQSSLSSHSLKSEPEKVQQSGAIKKTIQYQRSDSNSSLNGTHNTKKQVTSKIASIWKKIEETKKKTVTKKDSKKWIEAEVEPLGDATNSNVDSGKRDSDDNTPKRISRLGSFVVMDENEGIINIKEVN